MTCKMLALLTFDQQGHERNDGRLQLGYCQSVRPVVPGWVLWKQLHSAETCSHRLIKTYPSQSRPRVMLRDLRLALTTK